MQKRSLTSSDFASLTVSIAHVRLEIISLHGGLAVLRATQLYPRLHPRDVTDSTAAFYLGPLEPELTDDLYGDYANSASQGQRQRGRECGHKKGRCEKHGHKVQLLPSLAWRTSSSLVSCGRFMKTKLMATKPQQNWGTPAKPTRAAVLVFQRSNEPARRPKIAPTRAHTHRGKRSNEFRGPGH